MADRPYSHLGILELEELAGRFWASIDDLRPISEELSHRRKARAKRLEERVNQRLRDLSGGSETSPDPSEPTEDDLFALAGLHPSAPRFLIKAAQKAFRAHYHPDRYAHASTADRTAAEESFKRFERIFDAILSARESDS